MADQPEVVIVGKDGTEHVFPAGFDPKRAASIVNSGASAAPRTNIDRLVDALPMIGGMLGGAAGAATGIPTLGITSGPAAVAGAGILGAGGEAAKQLINRARGVAAPETSGEAATNIGEQGALQAVYDLVGQGVTKGLSAGGRMLYRGYLKPSLSRAALADAPQIVETGIKEGIPITAGGAAKGENVMTALRAKVDSLIAASKGDVNLTDVANQVRAWAKQQYYKPGQSMEDFNAAMKVADDLDQHPSIANPMAPNSPAMATPTAANDIKRGIYRAIGDQNYGVERGAATTARKVTGSQLKTALEQTVPGISEPNERLSRLIDLVDAVNHATGREANRNQLFGVPSLLSAGAGATEMLRGGGDRYGAAAVALATRMGLSPAVASRAAIWAAKMGDAMPGTAVADIARIAVQAMSEAGQDAQK